MATVVTNNTNNATNTSVSRAARVIEYRISQRLKQRFRQAPEPYRAFTWSDRLIAVLSVTVGLIVVGSFLEELIWVVLAAATVYGLGFNK